MSIQELLKLLGGYPENEDNLSFLLRQLATRTGVLPFVGAGMSAPFGFPSWRSFLLKLAEQAGIIKQVKTRLDALQYEEAAEDLLQALQTRRFQDLLSKYFGDQVIADRSLNGAVSELPGFPDGPIITTNFDRVLETVYQRAGKQLIRYGRSQASQASEAFQQDKPFVLKLHGDWEDQQSRILTVGEYAKAYGDIDKGRLDFTLPVPTLLFALMSTRCCLFLGCSLQQDRTMKVLSLVCKDRPDLAHYAIVERPKGAEKCRKRAAELSAQSIRPIWYTPGNHASIQPLLAFLIENSRKSKEPSSPIRESSTIDSRKVLNNIPLQNDKTIGRDAEIGQISEMLRGARLVSITGVGGCGKSRVAIDVASASLDRYKDGVWFIPLANLAKKADKEGVLPALVASIIGIPEQAKRPPNQALAERLSAGTYLLVLDNCEHLLNSCRELTGYLLQQCSGLSILTTSRRPIGISQERLYPLAPLKTVDPDMASLEQIGNNDSVHLFVERAKQKLPSYELTAANAISVAALCRALDGIPLAIEVAAARLGVSTVEQMNDDSRGLLASLGNLQSGDLRRWKTLTAALQWSYALLTPQQQIFMRSLAVFDGGWTEQSAAAVYLTKAHDPASILDNLQALYESSLIVSTDVRGSKRFRFLEPVREMAEAQLSPEERQDCERRHALFFLNLAEEAAPELLASRQAEWLETLQVEIDNLRAAHRWAATTVNAEVGLRLMAALWRFNEMRGYLNEGRKQAANVLAIAGANHFPELQSKVLSAAGMFAYRQGDFNMAGQLFEQSLQIERTIQNPVGIADRLNDLGNVARMNGDHPRARDLFQQSLAIQEEHHETRKIAVAKFNLGCVALAMSENQEASRLLNESLQSFQDAGNDWESGYPLNGLGQAAVSVGDYQLGAEYGEKSLSVRRKVGDKKGMADSLRTLGWASIGANDQAAARKYLSESISLARGLDDMRGISEALDLFALLSSHRGEVVEAVTLFAAAQHIRQSYDYSPPPARVSQRTAAIAAAKASLGDENYSAAWRNGCALEQAAAIEIALKG